MATMLAGHLPLQSSAFIPFCSFQQNLTDLGTNMINLFLPACTSFRPVVLEGRLCHQLDTSRLGAVGGPGERHSLMLLLDINAERSSHVYRQHGEFKTDLDLTRLPTMGNSRLFIHTLSPYTGHGPGHYKMSALKKTVGSEAFLSLPDVKKQCQTEEGALCEALAWAASLRARCGCMPAALATVVSQELAGLPPCGPNGTRCSQEIPVSRTCRDSCHGFYGDVPKEKREAGGERDELRMEELTAEYNKMKGKLARNLMYKSTSPKFSE
jgi:hypothetical protein